MREESLKDNLPKATAASKWSSSDFCRDVCSACAVSMMPRGFLQLVQTDVHGKQAFLGLGCFLRFLPVLKCMILFIYFGHALQPAGPQFPDQGLNLCPFHWKSRLLTSGLSEKSLKCMILKKQLCLFIPCASADYCRRHFFLHKIGQ